MLSHFPDISFYLLCLVLLLIQFDNWENEHDLPLEGHLVETAMYDMNVF